MKWVAFTHVWQLKCFLSLTKRGLAREGTSPKELIL